MEKTKLKFYFYLLLNTNFKDSLFLLDEVVFFGSGSPLDGTNDLFHSKWINEDEFTQANHYNWWRNLWISKCITLESN